MTKKRILLTLLILVCVVMAAYFWLKKPAESRSDTQKTTSHEAPKQTDKQSNTFNTSLYSTTDPSSIWVIVNKQHPLNPKDYVPNSLTIPNVPLRVPGNESMQLQKVTADALEKLFAGAKQDGIDLMLSSGYRSYAYQVNLYNGYVASQGQAEADTQSARPGHSEHQTGLAADVEPTSRVCEVEQCFGDTPEGKWLAANAYKYGFIIRYPADKVSITGYEYEPWHIRYIGEALATELHSKHVTTLEEYFGVSGGTSY